MQSNAQLVDYLVKAGRLRTERIINAFMNVDRIEFVPVEYKKYAYKDRPLPIGSGQTISQPSTVADMTEALQPEGKILEIGTGSGYQAAILSLLAKEVVTTERIASLAASVRSVLGKYQNISVMKSASGWKREAPYDCIIFTASVDAVPKEIASQAKPSGRILVPVGNEMLLITKGRKKLIGYYMFVPFMKGIKHASDVNP